MPSPMSPTAVNLPEPSPSIPIAELRCPLCEGMVEPADPAALRCASCDQVYPVTNGIPRMLAPAMREALAAWAPTSDVKVQTALSFGYEWTRFHQMRSEWERNFLEYMAPRGPDYFPHKRVLDAGCGTGRHAFYAAHYGASVWAVDLGPSVEVAGRNLEAAARVAVTQADLCNLPFERESFDFVYSLGVLHHLPDPEGAFQNILRYVKPNCEILIYLYWKPEGQPVKSALLAAVRLIRRLTIRLPHPVLHALSYPLAAAAFALFVLPYKLIRRVPGLRAAAERIPMKQYADYPFRVCVNDQFDRFSAPLENRYTRSEVRSWLERAGLEDVDVRPNSGWCASGRKPDGPSKRD